MISAAQVASTAFATRMYPALVCLREVTRSSPSAAAWQAFGRVALDIAGYFSTGDDILEEAIGALRNAISLRNSEREPAEWATAQIDCGRALFALSIYPSDRDALKRDGVECYRKALSVLSREREPELWAQATAALASSCPQEQRLDALRAAVAALSEDCFQEQRIPLMTELCFLLIEARASVAETRAAFEAEISLLEARKEYGYWTQWLDAQSSYGRWLIEVNDPSAAVRVLGAALEACAEGNEEERMTRDNLTLALEKAKRANH